MDFFKDFAAAGRRNATARVTITPLYAGHMRAVWAVGRNAQVASQPAPQADFSLCHGCTTPGLKASIFGRVYLIERSWKAIVQCFHTARHYACSAWAVTYKAGPGQLVACFGIAFADSLARNCSSALCCASTHLMSRAQLSCQGAGSGGLPGGAAGGLRRDARPRPARPHQLCGVCRRGCAGGSGRAAGPAAVLLPVRSPAALIPLGISSASGVGLVLKPVQHFSLCFCKACMAKEAMMKGTRETHALIDRRRKVVASSPVCRMPATRGSGLT